MGDTLSVEEHNHQVFRSLKPGDIVKIPRGEYCHFVLYIGKGKVVHLTSPDSGQCNSNDFRSRDFGHPGSMAEDNFFSVAGEEKVYKADKEEWPNFNLGLVLRKAKLKLGDSDYHLLTSRCENIVNELNYGKNQSDKVAKTAEVTKSADVTPALVGAGVGAVLLAGAAAVVGVVVHNKLSKNK
ncbi:phospholipase A and acyltransferase 3-like [Physella acuta]|uniref:phospholipase A and acyltransferase 3-like n=1 Tax=Physella acuta TaxID=109671 RepID=UPI0027DE3B61|nr:phospholipase A and acyltransferase 3-like [Physella acuta]